MFSVQSIKAYYSVIKCKNKIIDSVLSKNPLLHTDKADKKNHGKGISIVKSIAQKYGGDVVISEKNNEFIVSVIFRQPNFYLKTHYFYLFKIKYSKKCYPFFKALCQEKG